MLRAITNAVIGSHALKSPPNTTGIPNSRVAEINALKHCTESHKKAVNAVNTVSLRPVEGLGR